MPLEVEVAGCAVEAGPSCRADGPLIIWARSSPGAALTLRPPGEPLPSVDGGRRWRVPAGSEASALHVRATEADRSAEWRLARARGNPAPAPCEAANRRSAEARRRFAAGDVAAADAALAESVLGHEACGYRTAAVKDRLLRVHLRLAPTSTAAHDALGRDRLTEAQAILDGADMASNLDGASRVNVDYYRGLVAARIGDLRRAWDGFEAASARATRLELSRERRAVTQAKLPILTRLGRAAEVERLAEELLQASGELEACARGEVLTNVGWSRLLAQERTHAFGSDGASTPAGPDLRVTGRLLEEAARLKADCPRGAGNAYLNLALHGLHEGRTTAARAALEEAERRGLPPDLRPWWLEISGRIALAEGDPSAARVAFEAELATGAGDPERGWRAYLGLGRAREALSDFDGAEADYRAAEARADAALRTVGLDQGQSAFAAQQRTSSQALVELLLRRGRPGEALEVARRARVRGLRAFARVRRLEGLAPARRQAWSRAVAEHEAERARLAALERSLRFAPADQRPRLAARLRAARSALERTVDAAVMLLGPRLEAEAALPPLAPSQLTVAVHPGRTAWHAFAADTATVTVMPRRALPALDDRAAWSRWLLEPVAARIRAARAVRVLVTPEIADLDVPALPFDGAPLIAGREVVLGLDIAGARASERGFAVVLADPSDDLGGARREASAVSARLEARFDRVRVEVGRAADEAALRAALSEADLLHFAGHAVTSDRPLGATLELAGGGAITTADVLVSGRVPASVVLLGCETDRPSPGVPASMEGLAQAFLAAGAAEVLATHRPVRDETALLIARGLYLRAEPLSAALARAQRRLAENGVEDWSAFRVWVP